MILLLLNILITNGIGAIIGFFAGTGMDYMALNKPPLSPPGFIFPIVWTILYTLMAYASYRILKSDTKEKGSALKTYLIQLFFNFTWPILFFGFSLQLAAFFWILLLLYFIYLTIRQFLEIDKLAGYLLYPYFAWVLFAAYLTLGTYILNR